MSDKIYLRRGNKADLPALAAGEPGVALDTKQMFFGAAGGNVGLASVLSGGSKIESGSASINIVAANTQYSVEVTFPVAFGVAPTVFPILIGVGSMGSWVTMQAGNITTTGFTLYAASGAALGNIIVGWIALST